MFRTKALRTVALASTLLFGAGAFAANTSTDYDHNVNFRSYHTFSFYKIQTADPFLDQRLRDELTRDLAKAGYTLVPSGGDLNVTAFEGEKDVTEYNTFYDGLGGGGFGWGGWGGGRWGGAGYSNTQAVQVPVGTLLVDMYDSNTHQIVWRGRATSDLSNNAGKNTKKFDKDIDHMLNGFPPRAKG